MENKTGNISDSSSDVSESEIHEYKDKPYEELKQGKYVVKNRDGSLRCPFCPGKKKQQWQYRDLLQHASGVGSGAAWRKPKLKAQHLALTMYLTSDLAHEAEGGQMSSSSTNYRGDDREKPQGPLYDPTTPNCFCGMWATLRIAGPNSKHKGSLYYSCLKTGMERCKYFKWCLPISRQSHALGFADGYDDGFRGDAECKRNLDYYGRFSDEYEDFRNTGTRQGEVNEGIELQ
ncbi:hypothetical protein RHMOL_Rhmol02G0074000 [Rhododendron molle]|uniref:Uncharacterized protein n=1 Tax=Rhododendron molle TaxID=49168 RepID=A0ACC0PPX1_RHOML|nr:hypothetical protein RHMOL_Rhmol02G0074000 [Rhododendron molle]